MNAAIHRGSVRFLRLFPAAAWALCAALPAGVAAQAFDASAPGAGVLSAPGDAPLVEADPNLYACPDPLMRTVLTGHPADPGIVTAIRRKATAGARVPQEITYEGLGTGLDSELRDALNASPTTGNPSLPTSGLPADSAAAAPPSLDGSPPSPAASGRPPRNGAAPARNAREQLDDMTGGVRKACAGGDSDKDCLDGLWEDPVAQPAADAPQKRTKSE